MRHRKISLLEEARFPMRVWPNDIDIYGHVNNGRYLTLMDQGRLFHALACGWLPMAFRNRWKPIAGAATIVFRRELKVGDRFELVTQVAFWDEKAFYIEHRFEQGDTIAAQAFVRIVFKKGRETIAPRQVAEAMGFGGVPPECPAHLESFAQANRFSNRAPPKASPAGSEDLASLPPQHP